MRIGLFTTDFPFKTPFTMDTPNGQPYFWGGTAEVVYHMAMALDRMGHTVTVFATSPIDEDIIQSHSRTTVYRYAKKGQVASTWLSPGLLFEPLHHDLDIVHGHLGTPPGAFAGYIYSVLKRKPFVLTLHTTYNDVSLEGGSSARKVAMLLSINVLNRRMLRGADALTAVSRSVMADSPEFRRFIPDATLIPNGVDLTNPADHCSKEESRTRLGIGQGRKVILYVASLSPYKDPGTLVNAFLRLDPKDDAPYLVMVGDGPLKESLMKSVKASGREASCRFPGFVSEEEKRLYYMASDVFVLPSLAEAFGIVALEASSYGLPVIASDIEAFKDLVKDGDNGLLFKPGDADDLRLKISIILDDDVVRQEMGHNAEKAVGRFGWEQLIDSYYDIYRGLLR